MLYVTDHGDVREGDEAILFGDGPTAGTWPRAGTGRLECCAALGQACRASTSREDECRGRDAVPGGGAALSRVKTVFACQACGSRLEWLRRVSAAAPGTACGSSGSSSAAAGKGPARPSSRDRHQPVSTRRRRHRRLRACRRAWRVSTRAGGGIVPGRWCDRRRAGIGKTRCLLPVAHLLGARTAVLGRRARMERQIKLGASGLGSRAAAVPRDRTSSSRIWSTSRRSSRGAVVDSVQTGLDKFQSAPGNQPVREGRRASVSRGTRHHDFLISHGEYGNLAGPKRSSTSSTPVLYF